MEKNKNKKRRTEDVSENTNNQNVMDQGMKSQEANEQKSSDTDKQKSVVKPNTILTPIETAQVPLHCTSHPLLNTPGQGHGSINRKSTKNNGVVESVEEIGDFEHVPVTPSVMLNSIRYGMRRDICVVHSINDDEVYEVVEETGKNTVKIQLCDDVDNAATLYTRKVNDLIIYDSIGDADYLLRPICQEMKFNTNKLSQFCKTIDLSKLTISD